MPEMAGALDTALSARFRLPEPKSAATTLRGRRALMDRLTKAHGGRAAQAAASAGIPARTWRDWRSGAHPPSARNLAKLQAAYDAQIVGPFVMRAITDPKRRVDTIHVQADVVCDPDGSRYTNTPSYRWFRADGIKGMSVVQAWLHRGADAAYVTLQAEIKRSYGSVFAFEGTSVEVELIPK